MVPADAADKKVEPVGPLASGEVGPQDMNSPEDPKLLAIVETPPTTMQSFADTLKRIGGAVVPYGGLVSSVFNLCSVCIGAGILGLPAAANKSGIVMAMIYLVVIGSLGVYSLHILALVMEKTGLRTFEHTARHTMGRGFEHFVVVIRWVNSFGATVSYVISVGHIITPIVCEACGSPSFLKSWGGVRLLTFATWAIFMLPLVLPKKVNSLRYVSAFAMSFVLYFVLAVVIHGAQSGLPKMNSRKDGDEDGVRLFNTGNSAISALGVFMFSYVCQINCYEVYWEMKRCSASRFTSYAAISMAFCGVLYALTIIFAYGEFGGLVDNSVLLMYNPVVELMMMFGFIGMVIKLCVGYALQTMALRNTIYHVLRWDVETLPYWKHFSLVIPLSIVILIAGLFIPNINTVFGLVGAICGGFLSFIFPSLFYMYSGGWTRSKVGNFHYFCTYFLLLAGVVGLVFGTVSVAYENIVYLLMGDASAGNVAKDMCGNNIPVV